MDQTVPEQWGLEYTWGHRTEAAKMTPKEILIFISVIKPGIRACGSWDEQPGDALPKANVVHRGAAINDKGATTAPPCTWRGRDRYQETNVLQKVLFPEQSFQYQQLK